MQLAIDVERKKNSLLPEGLPMSAQQSSASDHDRAFDVLLEAAEANRAGKKPDRRDWIKFAGTVADGDLSPEHQTRVAALFRSHQHGYRRTAHNLGHMLHKASAPALAINSKVLAQREAEYQDMHRPIIEAQRNLEALLRERLCGDAKVLDKIRTLAKRAESGAIERIVKKLCEEVRPARKRASA